jgi:WD40 repeat protein
VPFDPKYLKALDSANIPAQLRFDGQPKELVAAFGSEKAGIYRVFFSNNGRYLLVASGIALVKWDLSNGKEIGRLVGVNPTYGMDLSPDDRRVACNDSASGIDLETMMAVMHFPKRVYAIAYTADARYLIRALGDCTLRLYDAQNDKELRAFKMPLEFTFVVAGSPDGRHMLSGSRDGKMRLWDLQSGKELRVFSPPGASAVNGVAFGPGGRHVFSSDDGGVVRRWSLSHPNETTEYERISATVSQMLLTPNGKTLAGVGWESGRVVLWDVDSGKIRKVWDIPGGSYGIAWARDGRHLAIANKNGTAYIMRLPAS